MLATESLVSPPSPTTWAMTDDQRSLHAASQRFARERLEPLLAKPPTPAAWEETVELAATLDLGTMILPARRGGLAVERHELSLVIEALAAGPLERAAELTLSAPALMTLRAHDALDLLPPRPVGDYFDGAIPLALTVPSTEAAVQWRLRQADTPGLTMQIDDLDRQRLILAHVAPSPVTCRCGRAITLGDLVLEQSNLEQIAAAPPLATIEQLDRNGTSPAQTWLTEVGLYLAALLTGAMQHSVTFALDYATSRLAFKKPLANHQLVATRLADMLIATHGAHLFLRHVTTTEPPAPTALVRQLIGHVAAESVDVNRELVQLCGGHGYVEGLPPAARFQSSHWFAWLLRQIDAALGRFPMSASSGTRAGACA
ncbi:MAG: acyl-CoA dehydrogenase [Pandoraea sp.]|uniref:Acyl-CoA dehydrogenase n=2 Tax=Burkholderiaceae TaxID=119060 RepID=A0A2N7VI38_9BURK|nr:acyl-CoA dehydrogenase family protein [Trinickia dabaoshanensis]PMS16822.1 acyl-CoA dehydrogenase [Trinickia dabaoshanensis]TAM18577.1 MAG: acyl-CoA dehydrogenase [Pandoraea sp.]TAM55320.1 MAG: acyl-CoA dehydrogenase [Paraburkholderia sp.]